MIIRILLLVVGLFFGASNANALLIDFNDTAGAAHDGASLLYGDYYTRFDGVTASFDGIDFISPGGYLYAIDPRAAGHTDASYSPYNDSDYLMGKYGLTLSSSDNSTFSLYSLDLGIWGNTVLYDIRFTANYADGSIISFVHTTDNVMNKHEADGNDFDYVLLEWENLTSVSIISHDYIVAVDNINTTAASSLLSNDFTLVSTPTIAIPSPATLLLFLIGLSALPIVMRLNKKR